jgi:hypothetical protein
VRVAYEEGHRSLTLGVYEEDLKLYARSACSL